MNTPRCSSDTTRDSPRIPRGLNGNTATLDDVRERTIHSSLGSSTPSESSSDSQDFHQHDSSQPSKADEIDHAWKASVHLQATSASYHLPRLSINEPGTVDLRIASAAVETPEGSQDFHQSGHSPSLDTDELGFALQPILDTETSQSVRKTFTNLDTAHHWIRMNLALLP